MARNIVVCCDGTANEFAENRTNVLKLYSSLVHNANRQVTFYHPGIGTMEPAGTLCTFTRKLTKLLGMAIGYGLEHDIRDGYVFLMQHFQPGDKVFLFGFSRGAYTVRALASLLHMYGLILPGNEPLVPYAIRMMTAVQRAPKSGKARQQEISRYFDLAEQFKRTLSRADCSPWFVGVWDTVSSVGWIENPLRLPYSSNNPSIAIGRHAVAIDEKRAFFRTNLWRPNQDPAKAGLRDMKQVWFAGVHCDVGGGYPESESGLSKIALEWMLREAETAGLLVDSDKANEVLGYTTSSGYVRPDPQAVVHKSLKGWWTVAEFIFKRHYDWKAKREERRMNLFRRRTIPEGSLVHESVFQRGNGYASRVPANSIMVRTESRSAATRHSSP